MGTRADFYVGRGKDAEWVGSIAWDGYPDGIPDAVKQAATEHEYRESLTAFFLDDRDDVSGPETGWPWPWTDSNTTDYAYAFDGGQVWFTGLQKWLPATEPEPEADEEGTPIRYEFPDMSKYQRVTLGNRSGVMVFGANDLTEED